MSEKSGNLKQHGQSAAATTSVGSHHPRLGSVVPLGHGVGQINLQIDISSAVSQLTTRCLILRVGFRSQAIRRRHSRDRWSRGRCHGNRFWDISCKWQL